VSRKRANGEGTIYQRKDSRWVASLTPPVGPRKYFYGRTRADVAAKLVKAQQALAEGRPLTSDRGRTVRAFLSEWLDVVKPSLRPLTHRYYSQKLNTHVIPALGRVRLGALTTPLIQRHLSALAKTLAPKTVKHCRDILRAALNDAVQWGYIGHNPAAAAIPPRAVRHVVQPLSPAEARQLLTAVQDHRLSALFTVALACGLRLGEALGLTWEDVDLDAGRVQVRQALQRVDGEWRRVEPKTERSRRVIPLPAVAVAALKDHRRRQLKDELKAKHWDHAWDGLVFRQEDGSPVYANNISRTFGDLLAKAGLARRRFHDLRHACASLLLAQGVPPSTVMEILGHSNLATTMHIYREVSTQAMGDAAGVMDRLLGTV
jgi:integrase